MEIFSKVLARLARSGVYGCVLLKGLVMSDIIVSSSAELSNALAAATGGENILLSAGEYDELFIKDLSYDSSVTVSSLDPDDPAVFTDSVTFVRADGLVLDGLVFDSETFSDGSLTAPLLFLHSCENVTMTDLVFTGAIPTEEEGVDAYAADTTRNDYITGYGYETGLRIHNSENVTLENATFLDLRYAIYVGESSGVSLTEMSIEQVREGIMFYETQDMIISDSVFQNFTPWLGMDDASYDGDVHDHPDMIQFWGDNSTTGVHDITITGNTFITETGSSTQTIFGHLSGASSDDVTATNFTVTDNLIINGHPHGISLGDVDGAVISGNVLLPNSDGLEKYWTPSIGAPGGESIEVYDNVLVYWNQYGVWANDDDENAAANITIGDNTLLSDDADDENYWGLWTAPSDYALVQAAEENGSGTIEGTDGNEALWANSAGSFLYGLGGDDTLAGRAGSDIMTGGDGADRFLFDLRGSSDQANDLILDLNFTEGDNIYVLTDTVGLFSDDVDAGNTLRVLGGGSATIIDSLADLAEIVASGAMTYESDGLGGGILSLTDGSGHSLQIAGIEDIEATSSTQAEDPLPSSTETGTDDSETLWASSTGSFLYGLGGDDTLAGRAGADIMIGGDGADRFLFDLRSSGADDTVQDLNFEEGDEIFVLTNTDGLFSNDADLTNDLWIGGDQSATKITSLADLQEVIDSGAMTYTANAEGGGILALADNSGYGLEITGLDPLLII